MLVSMGNRYRPNATQTCRQWNTVKVCMRNQSTWLRADLEEILMWHFDPQFIGYCLLHGWLREVEA